MKKLLKSAAFAGSACAMLALAQPAGAADGAAAAAAAGAATASVEAKASGTKKVCINVVPDTGSRMARRMCKTRADWADEGVDLNFKK